MYSKNLSPKHVREKTLQNEPAPNLRRRRCIDVNVDVRLGFLRLGRGRWIYDRRISFLFFGLLRGRIIHRRLFLFASREQATPVSRQMYFFIQVDRTREPIPSFLWSR